MLEVNWSTWHKHDTKENPSPDRNETHELPNTGWVLYPLNFKFTFLLIYHFHDVFDSANPSSMQDACHIIYEPS